MHNQIYIQLPACLFVKFLIFLRLLLDKNSNSFASCSRILATTAWLALVELEVHRVVVLWLLAAAPVHYVRQALSPSKDQFKTTPYRSGNELLMCAKRIFLCWCSVLIPLWCLTFGTATATATAAAAAAASQQ